MGVPDTKASETVPGLISLFIRPGQRTEDVLTPAGNGSQVKVAARPLFVAGGTVIKGVIGPVASMARRHQPEPLD